MLRDEGAACETCGKISTQVDCTPPGDLAVRVQQLRLSDAGYLKLTPWDSAGVGSVSAIAYKSSSAPVCTFILTCKVQPAASRCMLT
jgi:hypothetical protein